MKREKEDESEDTKIIKSRYGVDAGMWHTIEHQFIQGYVDVDGSVTYPSLSQLAETHRLFYGTIKKRAIQGEWVQKKEQWQRKINILTHYANADDYIQAAAKFDATCISVAQTALDAIMSHLMTEDDKEIDKLDLDRLGRAAVSWQRVGRLALGLSTENSSLKKQEIKESSEKTNESNVTMLNEAELSILDSFLTKVTVTEEEKDDKNSENNKKEE